MSQELIGGIPRSDLEFVVNMNRGNQWLLGHCLYEIGAEGGEGSNESAFIFAPTNTDAYWFLFDNLERESAQLLWVWRENWLKHGVNRVSSWLYHS